MKKFLFACAISVLLYFSQTQRVSAKIEVTFSQLPETLQSDQSTTIQVTISGADDTASYYLRGAFFEANTSSYFGSTLNNNSEWNSTASAYTSFYKTTGNGTFPFTIKPENTPVQSLTTQQYLFKIGRYTSSGSLTWSDQISNPTTITQIPPPTSSPSSTPSYSATPTATPTLTTSEDGSKIELSEVYPCAGENEKEWVELYNSGDVDVSIQGWKIFDNTDSHAVTLTDLIPAHQFFVVSFSSSIFNNSGDSVRLFSANNEIISQMSYEKCETQQSFIFNQDQWKATTTITKGTTNVLTEPMYPSPTPPRSISSVPTPPLSRPKKTEPTTEQIQSAELVIRPPKNLENAEHASLIQTSSHSPVVQQSATPAPFQVSSVTRSHQAPIIAFLFSGISYISSAAVFAQKWYTKSSGL